MAEVASLLPPRQQTKGTSLTVRLCYGQPSSGLIYRQGWKERLQRKFEKRLLRCKEKFENPPWPLNKVLSAAQPSFLGIPPELRSCVYGYVFEELRMYASNKWPRRAKHMTIALLLTCKLCYTEALPVAYMSASIRIAGFAQPDLASLQHCMNSVACANLRQLCLTNAQFQSQGVPLEKLFPKLRVLIFHISFKTYRMGMNLPIEYEDEASVKQCLKEIAKKNPYSLTESIFPPLQRHPHILKMVFAHQNMSSQPPFEMFVLFEARFFRRNKPRRGVPVVGRVCVECKQIYILTAT